MWSFVTPLVLGFTLNAASAFTATYSRWWGERGGRAASFVLRNVLGTPVWALGMVLAVRVPSSPLVRPGAVTAIAGWVLLAAGAMLILWALRSLGWRAAAPSARDTLIFDGAYSYVRHPIHVGTFLEFVGLWLLVLSLTAMVACMVGIIWLLVQSRLEETDLLERVSGYRQYMADVPRFVPGLRHQRGAGRKTLSLRESLQAQFNAGRGRLRFLALMSPT